MLDVVMLVDDNEADLVYTEVVLRSCAAAAEVLCFDTAAAALASLRERPASLILLDINMPEMDGFQFLAAYGELRATLTAPPAVVMLTSSPEPFDRERALAHPFVRGYLVKPLDDAGVAALARWAAGG